MTWHVICSDGIERHGGPFDSRRSAAHAATWSTCSFGHRFTQDLPPARVCPVPSPDGRAGTPTARIPKEYRRRPIPRAPMTAEHVNAK